MGLSSLPILNKLGYNSFWINSFNTDKFYSYNQSLFFCIEILLKRLTEERFFYKFYVNYKDTPQYYDQFKYKKELKYKKKLPLNYIGEVWFLMYSNFIILSPLYYSSSIIDKKKLKLKMDIEPVVFLYIDGDDSFENSIDIDLDNWSDSEESNSILF